MTSRHRTLLRMKPYPLLHFTDGRLRPRKAPLCAQDPACLVAVRIEPGWSLLQSSALQLLCTGGLRELVARTLKALTHLPCVCFPLSVRTWSHDPLSHMNSTVQENKRKQRRRGRESLGVSSASAWQGVRRSPGPEDSAVGKGTGGLGATTREQG